MMFLKTGAFHSMNGMKQCNFAWREVGCTQICLLKVGLFVYLPRPSTKGTFLYQQLTWGSSITEILTWDQVY